MEKINVAELLKNCFSGMELDCTIVDGLYFDKVTENDEIKCYTKEYYKPISNCNSIYFYSDGSYLNHTKSKCVIFPKGKTTWEGFVPPCKFKDGDILTNKRGSICIYKGPMYYNNNLADYYCGYRIGDHAFVFKKFKDNHFGNINEFRFASEIEKQHFFQIILDNGYKWNPETKTLEKLIKPKFKVGDKIVKKGGITVPVLITKVSNDFYYSNTEKSMGYLSITEQDNWELVPKKFDINTLVPFESRVLVRGCNSHEWEGEIFTRYADKSFNNCNFVTLGGLRWKQCIPYEDNQHLLGTTNDCDEYFKNWE